MASSDDLNGDKVPDLYPSLYPNVFNTGLINAPELSDLHAADLCTELPLRRQSAVLLAFPYIFPGAYS